MQQFPDTPVYVIDKGDFTWLPLHCKGECKYTSPSTILYIFYSIPNPQHPCVREHRIHRCISGRKSDKTVGEAQSQLISAYGCDGSRINFVHYSRHVGQESGRTLLAIIIANLLIQLTRPLQRLFLSACSMSQGLIIVCLKA